MELLIDHRIYSDACIAKAIYSLANRYSVNRSVVDDNIERLLITPIKKDDNDKSTEETFLAALNDYKLRQIIENETHDIRTILYAKAFAELDDIDEEDV